MKEEEKAFHFKEAIYFEKVEKRGGERKREKKKREPIRKRLSRKRLKACQAL